MGEKLNRTANDLFAFYLTHLNGEELTLVPAMWKHFTDEQLVAMPTNIEKSMTRERYAEFMRWVFPSLNINELTDTFMGLKKGAPQPSGPPRPVRRPGQPNRFQKTFVVKARVVLRMSFVGCLRSNRCFASVRAGHLLIALVSLSIAYPTQPP
jgi:hypothetical protein